MANEASKFTMADGTDVSIVDSRIGDLTSTGITGSTVAAQLKELNSKKIVGTYCQNGTSVDTLPYDRFGIYYSDSWVSVPDTSGSKNGTAVVIPRANQNCTQLYFTTDIAGGTYLRSRFSNGTYGAWKKITVS